MVGAFLFPVGIQATVLQPTDDELNAALNMAYENEPLMPLALTNNVPPQRKTRRVPKTLARISGRHRQCVEARVCNEPQPNQRSPIS